MRIERSLFTLTVGALLLTALWTAMEWPLRASIIVLVLGSVGLVLTVVQLVSDLNPKTAVSHSKGVAMDAPEVDSESRWGKLEIWSWILGFYLTIHLIGFLAAAPVFVMAYAKAYGGRWKVAFSLALLAWGFVYVVFERMLHVPWPKSLLGLLV